MQSRDKFKVGTNHWGTNPTVQYLTRISFVIFEPVFWVLMHEEAGKKLT